MGKKRKPTPASTPEASGLPDKKLFTVEDKSEESLNDIGESSVPERHYIFKDPNYHNKYSNQSSKKSKVWKSLKQIVAAERIAPGSGRVVRYASIEAPPSFKPAKKYSDVSGLPSKYTDPHTKLRYANVEEYSRVRLLSPDQVNGYLALRRANLPVP